MFSWLMEIGMVALLLVVALIIMCNTKLRRLAKHAMGLSHHSHPHRDALSPVSPISPTSASLHSPTASDLGMSLTSSQLIFSNDSSIKHV